MRGSGALDIAGGQGKVAFMLTLLHARATLIDPDAPDAKRDGGACRNATAKWRTPRC